MRKVSTTRAELLAHKDQLSLAKQGRDLLEQKRTVLMKEFMKVANIVMQHENLLQQAANRASQALGRAEAIAGVEQVHSAAFAAHGDLPINIKMMNVMGIKVPHIEHRTAARSIMNRGYAISGTSVSIDEAASAFEDEVEAILKLAESELRLARLAREIQSTSRRLNALENHLIPRLVAEEKFIQNALDERERSDHFRMKLIKRLIQEKADKTELS
jgi:V/A-type H+/Na+-transporting ATPase subunit D